MAAMVSAPAWGQYVGRGPSESTPHFVRYVENEFVVVFNAEARGRFVVGTTAAGRARVNVGSIQRLLERFGAERIRREFRGAPPAPGSGRPDLTGHYQVRLRAGEDLEDAIAAFEADPNVEHVEKIGVHPIYLAPNDPFYQVPPPPLPFDQWNLWRDHGIPMTRFESGFSRHSRGRARTHCQPPRPRSRR
jgi:hypothetical protein